MTLVLSDNDRKHATTKMLTGKYMLLLTNYDDLYGQDLLLVNKSKGIDKMYVVRLPKVPKPPVKKGRFKVYTEHKVVDKRDGYAYTDDITGVLHISNSMKRILFK